VKHSSTLTELQLAGNVHNGYLASASTLTSLRTLVLDFSRVTSTTSIENVTGLTWLRALKLTKVLFPNEFDIYQLGQLSNLRQLELHWCEGFVASHLKCLSLLHNLETFRFTPQQTESLFFPTTFNSLRSLSRLTTLALTRYSIDNADMEILATLPSLDCLTIASITNPDPYIFGKFKTLTRLDYLGWIWIEDIPFGECLSLRVFGQGQLFSLWPNSNWYSTLQELTFHTNRPEQIWSLTKLTNLTRLVTSFSFPTAKKWYRTMNNPQLYLKGDTEITLPVMACFHSDFDFASELVETGGTRNLLICPRQCY